MLTNLKHGDTNIIKKEKQNTSLFIVMKIIQISFLEVH